MAASLAVGCGPVDGTDDADVAAADASDDRASDADRDGHSDLDAIADVASSDARDGAADVAAFDAPESCVALGRPGVCLPTARCTGLRMSVPGFCPGPVDVQCCVASTGDAGLDATVDAALDAVGDSRTDGVPTDGSRCDPMAMPTPNRDFVEEPGGTGCPDGMARIDAYCVDRFEASLALVNSDGTFSPWSPYFNPGTRRVRAFSVRRAVPQGYVNATQAAAACGEAGKRLCSDVEWLRACRGASSTVYPYGSARMPGACNDARGIHPAVEYFGTSASWIYSMLGNACINQLPMSLAPTGSLSRCVTPEGLFDMMGNLHEWTADPAGTFRGGFYVDTRLNGEGCLYATTAHDVSHWDYSTGFRCCATAR